MLITLYSTNCPKCKMLEAKLKSKNLEYNEVTDMDTLLDKGFMSMPMLEVDGDIMNYKQAIDWVNELGD